MRVQSGSCALKVYLGSKGHPITILPPSSGSQDPATDLSNPTSLDLTTAALSARLSEVIASTAPHVTSLAAKVQTAVTSQLPSTEKNTSLQLPLPASLASLQSTLTRLLQRPSSLLQPPSTLYELEIHFLTLCALGKVLYNLRGILRSLRFLGPVFNALFGAVGLLIRNSLKIAISLLFSGAGMALMRAGGLSADLGGLIGTLAHIKAMWAQAAAGLHERSRL